MKHTRKVLHKGNLKIQKSRKKIIFKGGAYSGGHPSLQENNTQENWFDEEEEKWVNGDEGHEGYEVSGGGTASAEYKPRRRFKVELFDDEDEAILDEIISGLSHPPAALSASEPPAALSASDREAVALNAIRSRPLSETDLLRLTELAAMFSDRTERGHALARVFAPKLFKTKQNPALVHFKKYMSFPGWHALAKKNNGSTNMAPAWSQFRKAFRGISEKRGAYVSERTTENLEGAYATVGKMPAYNTSATCDTAVSTWSGVFELNVNGNKQKKEISLGIISALSANELAKYNLDSGASVGKVTPATGKGRSTTSLEAEFIQAILHSKTIKEFNKVREKVQLLTFPKAIADVAPVLIQLELDRTAATQLITISNLDYLVLASSSMDGEYVERPYFYQCKPGIKIDTTTFEGRIDKMWRPHGRMLLSSMDDNSAYTRLLSGIPLTYFTDYEAGAVAILANLWSRSTISSMDAFSGVSVECSIVSMAVLFEVIDLCFNPEKGVHIPLFNIADTRLRKIIVNISGLVNTSSIELDLRDIDYLLKSTRIEFRVKGNTLCIGITDTSYFYSTGNFVLLNGDDEMFWINAIHAILGVGSTLSSAEQTLIKTFIRKKQQLVGEKYVLKFTKNIYDAAEDAALFLHHRMPYQEYIKLKDNANDTIAICNLGGHDLNFETLGTTVQAMGLLQREHPENNEFGQLMLKKRLFFSISELKSKESGEKFAHIPLTGARYIMSIEGREETITIEQIPIIPHFWTQPSSVHNPQVMNAFSIGIHDKLEQSMRTGTGGASAVSGIEARSAVTEYIVTRPHGTEPVTIQITNKYGNISVNVFPVRLNASVDYRSMLILVLGSIGGTGASGKTIEAIGALDLTELKVKYRDLDVFIFLLDSIVKASTNKKAVLNEYIRECQPHACDLYGMLLANKRFNIALHELSALLMSQATPPVLFAISQSVAAKPKK